MKTIEENKVKALFMSNYIWQQVYNRDGWGDAEPMRLDPGFLDEVSVDKGFLQLRDIIELTDEEASTLSYIAQNHPSVENLTPNECWSGEGDMKPDGSTWVEVGCRCWEGTLKMTAGFGFTLVGEDGKEEQIYNQTACVDYLKLIGILTPFTYLSEAGEPITLSTEEIIQKGWAKTHNQLSHEQHR